MKKMKKITLIVLTLTMGFLGLNLDLNAQTKVFDQTITWTHPPYENGGYGFYWWHRTDGYSIINYGNMPSDNWYSPNDYYNGNFTMSVQVISQPTNESFYLQFGIWGDYSKGSLHTETVAGRYLVSGGAGSTGYFSMGSPSGWWQKQPSDPLDFSRANDFYRIGVVLWDAASTCIPMGHDWNPTGCPENAYKYFPMTIKISVYATAGSGPPPPPPPPPVTAPSYSIDYWGERTNKVVSTEDQYSYSSNFSPAYDGNGQYLSLSPGTNVYFRKKADYSKTQTLSVAGRPAAPSFGIDFVNERTSSAVSNEYQYSSSSDMSSATTGNGSPVGLSPGSSRYFRKLASASAFASSIQTLTAPGRPAAPSFDIDYPNERTSSVVSSEYQYSSSSDMSSATTGSGSFVGLSPGSSRYFRKLASASAFASSIQTLAVPGRPAAPSFGIDYPNERTSSVVTSDYQYSSNNDMSSATNGSGSFVGLNPGSNLYFRKAASASAFASSIQNLAVPARPAAPSFQIDYILEMISTPIGSGYSYGYQPDLGDAKPGSNNVLKVTPGVNIYFRAAASASAFASEIQTLVSQARPGAPSVGINFLNETTDISIPGTLQYSGSIVFEAAQDGTGASLSVVPGDDLYFRHKATASSYASEIFHLTVPERPLVSSMESGSTELYPFIATITFNQDIASLDNASVTLVNAELNNLSLKSSGSNETIFEGLVFATANDNISVSLPANATAEGNFVSNIFTVSYTGNLPGTGISSGTVSSFVVFPNPGKGIFYMKFEDFSAQTAYKVELCSITGKVVHTESFQGAENVSLDLSGLADGIYLMRLLEDNQLSGTLKLIIK